MMGSEDSVGQTPCTRNNDFDVKDINLVMANDEAGKGADILVP